MYTHVARGDRLLACRLTLCNHRSNVEVVHTGFGVPVELRWIVASAGISTRARQLLNVVGVSPV
ncbi:hypothetical protein CYJ75_12315 [Kocuria rhizophila]|nr:hypothetical protein CYJ75_12315 [Kocuria rhizophila]